MAPVPVGMEPGTPFGTSIQSLATSGRYTPAISYEQLAAALFTQVFGLDISEGALANLFQRVKPRLDHHVAAILTRLRSSRLIGRDETRARVNGQQQWEMGVTARRSASMSSGPSGAGRDPGSPGRAMRPTIGALIGQYPTEAPC